MNMPSPCNGVCRVDTARGCCAGCLRTLDEIAGWSGFSDERRRAVWQELRLRGMAGAGAGTGPGVAATSRATPTHRE